MPRKWAVAVFMIADEALVPAALSDIGEMRAAGSTEDVAVLVQLQTASGKEFQRYEVGRVPASRGPQFGHRLAPLESKEKCDCNNPGSSETLRNFLLWVDTEYQPEHVLLVLWGHSWGVGFGRFDLAARNIGPIARDPNDGLLHLEELRVALREFKAKRRKRGANLDVLGTSTCRTSKVEVAIELSETVDFLVASQIGIPILTGWPFDQVLQILEAHSGAITPENLAEAIVTAYTTSFRKTVSLAALNLSESAALCREVKTLATAILDAIAHLKDGAKHLIEIKLAFSRASLKIIPVQGGASEPVVDFAGLCDELVLVSTSPKVTAAATMIASPQCGRRIRREDRRYRARARCTARRADNGTRPHRVAERRAPAAGTDGDAGGS